MTSGRSALGSDAFWPITSSSSAISPRNTQKSYRDSFKLLLPFISAKVHKPVDRLDVEDLTPSRVLQFLAHLEEERDCCSADSQPTPDGNPILRPLRRQS